MARWRKAALGVSAALAIASGPASAQNQGTAQLAVSATVQNTCSVTGGSLSFGTYTSGQSQAL
ncbi:MAG: spore coat protein U domain-containing protein, partial [Geminicoccaceae bacterium]|nr:spore coat protein U domain-containing protein [Geminicoccaceae bacterium]MDW8342154.1 spore coat protein U domain-containing protein [Geminicoccaceae bacterium]